MNAMNFKFSKIVDKICILFKIERKFHLEPFMYLDEETGVQLNNPENFMTSRVLWLEKKTVLATTEAKAMNYWSMLLQTGSKHRDLITNYRLIQYF